MLTRIVKLTFKTENIANFIRIFEETEQFIQNFEGCISLELFQDLGNPNIFFTYSKWESEDYLDLYRSSDFFKNVWGKTKPLFDAKPEAWSVQKK
ncbi:MAG: antibiotic biosynthesis monooxygenase [Maribacter sp.]